MERLRLLLALVSVLALGLISRLYPVGCFLYDKSLGDILYAVAGYLTLSLLFIRCCSLGIAALTLGLCLAIEFFQATGIPIRHEHIVLVRWLLGTTFAWHDIGCYFVGVTIITILDVFVLRVRTNEKR